MHWKRYHKKGDLLKIFGFISFSASLLASDGKKSCFKFNRIHLLAFLSCFRLVQAGENCFRLLNWFLRKQAAVFFLLDRQINASRVLLWFQLLQKTNKQTKQNKRKNGFFDIVYFLSFEVSCKHLRRPLDKTTASALRITFCTFNDLILEIDESLSVFCNVLT